MPGYKGHLMGGAVAASVAVGGFIIFQEFSHGHLSSEIVQGVTPTENFLRPFAIFAFCMLGSLFPDVDTDSKGQHVVYTLFVAINAFLLYKKNYKFSAWLGLFAMLPALGHHRGWTHSWLILPIMGLPLLLIPYWLLGPHHMMTSIPYYLAFTLGYFSHLLLDFLP